MIKHKDETFEQFALRLHNAPAEDILDGIDELLSMIYDQISENAIECIRKNDVRYLVDSEVRAGMMHELIKIIKEGKIDDQN